MLQAAIIIMIFLMMMAGRRCPSSDCELLFTVKCQYWLLPVLPASVLFLYDRLTDNGKTSGETYLLP
jgi:hypothetical protein